MESTRRDWRPDICILLASYRGQRFIEDQLSSIEKQTYSKWLLIVSDDGSNDETCDVVRAFAKRRSNGQVSLIKGPGQGYARNFLHLLRNSPKNLPIAFCDQDDVWFPDKLSRAIDLLKNEIGPAHYAARTVIAEQNLKPIKKSREFKRALGFRNALVQACMSGNTSVFNESAADILRDGATYAEKSDIAAHDWWAYILTSGVGAKIFYDPDPVLYYRQHDGSSLGRNDTMVALMRRIFWLGAGDYGSWVRRNIDAIIPMRGYLSSDNLYYFDKFRSAIDRHGPAAVFGLMQSGVYRHTIAATAALYAAGLTGRL